jgi:methionyl-tRNA formyltransferase
VNAVDVGEAILKHGNSSPSAAPRLSSSVDRKLRVLFITEDDPLYVIRFFEVFLAEYPRSEFEICGITVAAAFQEPLWRTARRMLRFYGPMDFCRLTLRYLAARARRVSIAGLAADAGVPIMPARSVNDPAYVARVQALIFRRELLESPRIGCINIHSGRLPKYRGMMPTFWQLLHGEQSVTVTIHEMVSKLDAGCVLASFDYPVARQDSLDRVMQGTKQEGARLMIATLRLMAAGQAQYTSLDLAAAEYFSFPRPADVRQFRRLGHRLL